MAHAHVLRSLTGKKKSNAHLLKLLGAHLGDDADRAFGSDTILRIRAESGGRYKSGTKGT